MGELHLLWWSKTRLRRSAHFQVALGSGSQLRAARLGWKRRASCARLTKLRWVCARSSSRTDSRSRQTKPAHGVMGCEHASLAGQVFARARNLRGQTLEAFALGHGNRNGTVSPGPLERVGQAAVGQLREALGRQWATCEVAR